MVKKFLIPLLILLSAHTILAQQKKPSPASGNGESISAIPVSNADPGTFPFFKTFPNFRPLNESDSVTVEQNKVYFFDGKKYFPVEGKVSSQKLELIDDKKKRPSEFQIIQEFDKIITTLGGKKIHNGKLPTELLKPVAGTDDIVSLCSKYQLVQSAYYGVVEYVIKTPEKEIWVQLQPFSIGSNFYTLLVIEKQSQLLTINTNKQNLLLSELEKKSTATLYIDFFPDSTAFTSASGDELLQVIQVFQVHPEWKIKIDLHSAPVGKPEYVLSLTQQRAEAIKQALISLGAKSASIEAKGWGDQKPVLPNETEKARQVNTRVTITRI